MLHVHAREPLCPRMLAANIRRDSGICLVSVRICFPQMRPHSRFMNTNPRGVIKHASRVFNDPHRRCPCVRPWGIWKLPDRLHSRVDIRSFGISEHPEAHLEGTSCKLAILRTTARVDLIRWDCFSDELGWVDNAYSCSRSCRCSDGERWYAGA